MDINGKGMTQQDLELLPEANVVLWQPDDEGPVCVTDKYGAMWSIGFYKGVLSRRRLY